MNYKNQTLTFERTLDFDGMTDSAIPGDKKLITGKCTRYHRSGYHRTWYIEDQNGTTHRITNTFETLKAINGKEI
jgi:hypothetical protein